jgi:hypothetical protein
LTGAAMYPASKERTSHLVQEGYKLKRLVFAVILAAGTLVGTSVAAVPAYATVPPSQIGYNSGSSSLCFNRAGSGTSTGTPVIAYNCGQPNNDFYFVVLANMCGGGRVTAICPFTVGSGLNDAYENDVIVDVRAYYEDECVGGSTLGATDATLQACPDSYGNGGGWSTIDVLAFSANNNDADYDIIVNRNWSDLNYTTDSGCNGYSCTDLVGAPLGYKDPLQLNTVDTYVQQGDVYDAAPWDQWTEIETETV